ncbi:uncharacterized protein LOC144584236 [Pogona vitticeps]
MEPKQGESARERAGSLPGRQLEGRPPPRGKGPAKRVEDRCQAPKATSALSRSPPVWLARSLSPLGKALERRADVNDQQPHLRSRPAAQQSFSHWKPKRRLSPQHPALPGAGAGRRASSQGELTAGAGLALTTRHAGRRGVPKRKSSAPQPHRCLGAGNRPAASPPAKQLRDGRQEARLGSAGRSKQRAPRPASSAAFPLAQTLRGCLRSCGEKEGRKRRAPARTRLDRRKPPVERSRRLVPSEAAPSRLPARTGRSARISRSKQTELGPPATPTDGLGQSVEGGRLAPRLPPPRLQEESSQPVRARSYPLGPGAPVATFGGGRKALAPGGCSLQEPGECSARPSSGSPIGGRASPPRGRRPSPKRPAFEDHARILLPRQGGETGTGRRKRHPVGELPAFATGCQAQRRPPRRGDQERNCFVSSCLCTDLPRLPCAEPSRGTQQVRKEETLETILHLQYPLATAAGPRI